MAKIGNLVQQTSITIGTGDFTTVSVNGKRDFATEFSTGGTDVFYYFISHQTAAEWEYGTGHMSASNTLVRDTVIQSSNANALVNFSLGTKDVVNDLPASLQALLESTTGSGAIVRATSPTLVTPALGTPTALVGTNITGTAAGLTAGTATVANTLSTANEATDTTCFPLFVTASGTQSLQPKNNTTWTFNSNTGAMAIPSLTLTTDLAVADGGTGASTFTDAGVLIGNGTGAIQVTSAGTAGHVLTSNGAGVDPTFQASAAGAGITAVSGSPSTPSGVPNVDFTSISGGNDLIATWSGISSGTNTRQLLIKPSIAGVFGGTDILIQASFNVNAATPTQLVSFTGAVSNLAQAAATTCSGTLTIYNYASSTHYKAFKIEGKALTGASERAYVYFGTFYNASAIDGLRFYWANGSNETEQAATNFDAGTINVGTRV